MVSTQGVAQTIVTVAVLLTCLGAVMGAPAAAQQGDENRAVFNATITENGELATADVTMWMGPDLYRTVKQSAEERGYDNAAIALAESYTSGDSPYGDYESLSLGGADMGFRISFELTELDIDRSDSSTIITTNDTVMLLQGNVTGPNDHFQQVTYNYEMPGEVVRSNAYNVTDTTATYELHEDSPNVFMAEAQRPSATENDGSELPSPLVATGGGGLVAGAVIVLVVNRFW